MRQNKNSSLSRMKENFESEWSWRDLDAASDVHGDAFYVLDMNSLDDNLTKFIDAFKNEYSNVSIGYPFKTNYIPQVCIESCRKDSYAEVVSRMEYNLALDYGIEENNIIFNGPAKRKEDLKYALLNGSKVNMDSLAEVHLTKKIIQENLDNSFEVGLRCNFDIGTDRRSRFGLSTDDGQLQEAFEMLDNLTNCEVSGLHFHSSERRDLDSYRLRAEKLISLSSKLFSDRKPQYIDIGGGFFGHIPEAMREQFDARIPGYKEYAQAVAPLFAKEFGRKNGPELILEPGVGIVADVMHFVTRVIDIRSIGSRNFAITGGSIQNIKPASPKSNFDLPVTTYHKEKKRNSKVNRESLDIVGYTCMENDILYKGFDGHLEKGDFVAFHNVGAYTIVFKPPFIRTAPPIVMSKDNQNGLDVVRKKKTAKDVMSTYIY